VLGALLEIGGKRVLNQQFGRTVKAIEARGSGGSPAG